MKPSTKILKAAQLLESAKSDLQGQLSEHSDLTLFLSDAIYASDFAYEHCLKHEEQRRNSELNS